MNKILMSLFIIGNFNFIFSHDISAWAPAKLAASKMEQGVIPSIIAANFDHDYIIIMVDDQNLILGLQAKSGGIAFIFRSENNKVLFKTRNFVVSIPAGHSDKNSDTMWSSAILDKENTDMSKYSFILFRKNSNSHDKVTFNRTKSDFFATWNFQ